MEEKMKEFKHILKIINLYIEYMNKIDKIKEKEKTKNEKGWQKNEEEKFRGR